MFCIQRALPLSLINLIEVYVESSLDTTIDFLFNASHLPLLVTHVYDNEDKSACDCPSPVAGGNSYFGATQRNSNVQEHCTHPVCADLASSFFAPIKQSD